MTDQPPRSPGQLGTLCGLAILAFAAAWLGCAGDLDPAVRAAWVANNSDGGGGAGTGGGMACNAPGSVISPKCTLGCHVMGAALGGGLDLSPAVIVANLLGRMSTGAADSMCGGNTTAYLVRDSNPATGLFLDKLTPTFPCGVRMPIGAALIPSEETCVRDWATAVTTGRITQ
jgi:hypothetical protein